MDHRASHYSYHAPYACPPCHSRPRTPTGSIKMKEFTATTKSFVPQATNADIKGLFDSLDKDGGGSIDPKELLDLMYMIQKAAIEAAATESSLCAAGTELKISTLTARWYNCFVLASPLERVADRDLLAQVRCPRCIGRHGTCSSTEGVRWHKGGRCGIDRSG